MTPRALAPVRLTRDAGRHAPAMSEDTQLPSQWSLPTRSHPSHPRHVPANPADSSGAPVAPGGRPHASLLSRLTSSLLWHPVSSAFSMPPEASHPVTAAAMVKPPSPPTGTYYDGLPLVPLLLPCQPRAQETGPRNAHTPRQCPPQVPP